NIAWLSAYANEEEVLFPPKTRYKIESVVSRGQTSHEEFLGHLERIDATDEVYSKVNRIVYADILTDT
ncbi:MAG: hypothetical protein ABEI96_09395, partial [Haloarculaceae archaeon]